MTDLSIMDREVIDNIISAISNGRTDIVRTLVSMCERGDGSVEGFHKDLAQNNLLNDLCTEHGSFLHLATKLNHVDIVRTLLSCGADPSIKNNNGETPYQLAGTRKMATVYTDELLHSAAKSNIERIEKLVAGGVPIDGLDSSSNSNRALNWAATFGSAATVQRLLDLGASVDAVNVVGYTALHDAVVHKRREVMQVLLEAGADPLMKCSGGKNKDKTAFDLADDNEEILSIIKMYKKNVNGNTSANSSLESIQAEDGSDHMGRLSIVCLDEQEKSEPFVSRSCGSLSVPPLPAPPPLITDNKLYQLWPFPREIVQTGGPLFKLSDKYSVCIIHNSSDSIANDVTNDAIALWRYHIEEFSSVNVNCVIESVCPCSSPLHGSITCVLSQRLFDKPQCYKIVIAGHHIKISASDISGLHYALCTLKQLFVLYKDEVGIPALYVKDWPVCKYRGVLVDLVPGARKPNLDTLKGYIKVFSFLKLNQLHFYFRFDPKTRNKWPYSNSDLISVASLCRQVCINPVPALEVSSECTYEDLCYKYSLPFQELMALFSSRDLHLGPLLSRLLLEMLALGSSARTRDIFSQVSNGTLYMWINEYTFDEKLFSLLPSNVVIMQYGYQTDCDFDTCLKPFVLAGFPVYAGVGTATWGSIAGSPETAINTAYKASQCAASLGALGMVVADWKTVPHHSAFSFSWPGILVTAGLSWNNSIHLDFLFTHIPLLMDNWILLDSEKLLGKVLFELGRLESFIHETVRDRNASFLRPWHTSSSILHQLLTDPDNVRVEYFTVDAFKQAIKHIKRFGRDIQRAKPECFQKGEVIAELKLAIDLMIFACKLARALLSNGGNPFSGCGVSFVNCGVGNLPPTTKTDLANRLLAANEKFRGVWLSRYLPCGLQKSLFMFSTLLRKFVPDSELFSSSSPDLFHRF